MTSYRMAPGSSAAQVIRPRHRPHEGLGAPWLQADQRTLWAYREDPEAFLERGEIDTPVQGKNLIRRALQQVKLDNAMRPKMTTARKGKLNGSFVTVLMEFPDPERSSTKEDRKRTGGFSRSSPRIGSGRLWGRTAPGSSSISRWDDFTSGSETPSNWYETAIFYFPFLRLCILGRIAFV